MEKNGRFELRIDPTTGILLEVLSTQLGIDRSSFVRYLIMQAAENHQRQAKETEPAPVQAH